MAISGTHSELQNSRIKVKTLMLDGTDITATAAEINAIAGAGLDATELGLLNGVTAGTAIASKVVTTSSSIGVGGGWRDTRTTNMFVQGAPAAKTTSTTLTAAELLGQLITGNQGAAGAAAYTLPLATDLETALLAAFPGLATNDAFDFTVINLSTNAAEDITMTTNTGWTLVGNMVVESNTTNTNPPSVTFRVRRTAANTYTLYRIAG